MGTFVLGIGIGFSIAAPVGPIGVLCIRRTLAQGTKAGLVTGLGAATADAVYGFVAGMGLTFVTNTLIAQQSWLRLLGGTYLCLLGLRTIFARKGVEDSLAGEDGSLSAFASTFVLTLTNPMTILSFLAIFAGLGVGSTYGDYGSAGFLVVGVFTGSALWWLTLSGTVGLIRSKFSPLTSLWINRIAGAVITGFGLLMVLGF